MFQWLRASVGPSQPQQNCHEEFKDGATIKQCSVTYQNIDIEQTVGIEVKEVEFVEQAFKEMVT